MKSTKNEMEHFKVGYNEGFVEGYHQGKLDGAKDFADRLRVNFDLLAWNNSDEVIDYTLAEMQKEVENG